MRDFTTEIYNALLVELKRQQYQFYTFEKYLVQKPAGKIAILRHDVDLLPFNSVATAQIEHNLGIEASYYFRIVKESNDPVAIQKIQSLGHEIGYHYEDLALCKGNTQQALLQFAENLSYFRQFYPVKSICMHGSPLSKFDNRSVWKDQDYKTYGLIGEPYFDLDFKLFYYLTDTGRKWDGEKEVIRDKVEKHFSQTYHATFEIIANANQLPDNLMITTHPQRWTNSLLPWMKELVLQNAKNTVKVLINRR